MRKQLTRADAETIREEVDTARGYPRVHTDSDGELVRVGGGIHADVTVMIDDADERHIEPARRARLRAAKAPVEDKRPPEERGAKSKR